MSALGEETFLLKLKQIAEECAVEEAFNWLIKHPEMESVMAKANGKLIRVFRDGSVIELKKIK